MLHRRAPGHVRSVGAVWGVYSLVSLSCPTSVWKESWRESRLSCPCSSDSAAQEALHSSLSHYKVIYCIYIFTNAGSHWRGFSKVVKWISDFIEALVSLHQQHLCPWLVLHGWSWRLHSSVDLFLLTCSKNFIPTEDLGYSIIRNVGGFIYFLFLSSSKWCLGRGVISQRVEEECMRCLLHAIPYPLLQAKAWLMSQDKIAASWTVRYR